MNAQNILRIDASGRFEGSVTRQLTDHLIENLSESNSNTHLVTRELASGLPFINEQWIGANFTPAEQRNEGHKQALELSDKLVAEIEAADTLVIASPIYNFSVPAVLKAWIDMVARAGLTFKYTEQGPVGLLEGKKAYLVIASGGTPLGSDWDFTSGYLKHVLGFIGITDVTLIDASKVNKEHPKQSIATMIGKVGQLDVAAVA